MANSYTKIYIQYVFTVKGRQNLISPQYNSELQKYITGIVQKRKCKMLAINNMPDHVHMLIGFNPSCYIPKLIQEVKANSSKIINEKKWVKCKFRWQIGYGAFSYSCSNVDNVIRYIANQQIHHKKRSFKEEYIEFLEKFKVEYDDQYMFEFYD